MRSAAEARAFAALSGMKLRVFQWVLARARRRVADRENLRFLRTRIFGRVRDLFLAMGGHMHAAGALSNPRDIFWLTTDEVFGWVRGTTVTTNLQGLVTLRHREYEGWREAPEPADRFRTWGPVWANNAFLGKPAAPRVTGSGLPACPGRVEGRVVRVLDPNQGATSTGPSWWPTVRIGLGTAFPRIAALVVERGSLSHSAVVAREMGIPSVVAVSGVMDALATGDRIRLDAVAGTIDVLEKAE